MRNKYLNSDASYSSSVKELGKVVNPTCDIRLRIGVPSMSIFKQYANVIQDHSENVTSFKGFAIDLFYETVKKLPYHLEYDYFAFNGTYDELVKQVYLKVRFITPVCCSSLHYWKTLIIDNHVMLQLCQKHAYVSCFMHFDYN